MYKNRKAFAKASCSSLGLHVDESHDAKCHFGGLRGQLVARSKDGSGLVVVKPAPRVIALANGKSFGNIEDSDYEAFEPYAVGATDGSFLFWAGNGVHANCKPGHKLPLLTTDAQLSYDEALADPSKVYEYVGKYGACIVIDTITPTDCARFVDACTTAILASRRDAENGFKGSGGCSLFKWFGISTHEALRPFAVHDRILALWAAVLFGDPSLIDELCYSPDAIAVAAKDNGCGDLHSKITRAAFIMCYGKKEDQPAGHGDRKLRHYMEGGTCNHPPCKFTNGGKGGHMSNGGDLEKRWVSQVPTWGADPDVDERFIRLLGAKV